MVVALAFAFQLTPVNAQDEIAQAQELLNNRQAGAAYQLLAEHEDELAGDPKFDYLLGIAALDSGHVQHAVFALERVLAVEPDNALARAEIARAYFELAEYQTARTEFDHVKQSPATPDSARATVDEYLALIDRATTVSPYSGFVSFSAGWDSNINSATDEGSLVIPSLVNFVRLFVDPSGAFPTPDDVRAQSHAYTMLAGGLNLAHPVSQKFSVIGGTRAYIRSPQHVGPWENSTFSTRDVYGYGGLRYQEGRHQVTVAGQGEHFAVDGSTLRNNLGGFVQWTYLLDESSRINLSGQYSNLDYPHIGARDADRYVGSLGYVRALGGPREAVIYAAFYGGVEDEDDSDFPQFGHDLYGGNIGGGLAIFSRLRGYAATRLCQRFVRATGLQRR